MRIKIALSLLIVFAAACGSKDNSSITTRTYFDIKGYFEKEADRLQQRNPLIEKSVAQNNQPETKDVKISNWPTELELFTESDINKPAWKDSYRRVNNGNLTELVSKDKGLKTQKISIEKDADGNIVHIFILNNVSNSLYTTTEELNYFPDSLYRIVKHQAVQVIGKNTYSIVGKFKN